MKDLRKADKLTIRFTSEQLLRLRRAAERASRARREIVDPSTLGRELILAALASSKAA